MFDNYDPGFLPGFIGLVVGSTFTFILQQIMILCRFQEQLESLEKQLEYHDNQISPHVIHIELEKLVLNASKMVELGRNVPWFDVFSRHQLSKSMNKMISAIEDEKHQLLIQIVFIQHDIIKKQQARPPLAEKMPAEEQTEYTTREMPAEEEEKTCFMQKARMHTANAAESIMIDPDCMQIVNAAHVPNIDPHATTEATSSICLPTYDEEPIYNWLCSENDDSFHKLFGTLMSMNFTREKQQLIRRVKQLVEMIRQEVKSQGYNHDSTKGRWLLQLDRLLNTANEMVEPKEPRRDILHRYLWNKRINRLLSEIDVHMKLIPLTVLPLER